MNTLYLDMDDVLVDFKGYATKLLKKTTNEERWPENEWNKLKDNVRLYRDLDKTVYADQLVAFCVEFCKKKQYELKILTAVPKNNDVHWAFYDKVLWVLERYPDIPVMFGPYSKDKHLHCKPNDILIDDRTSNINEWINAGGIGIQHLGDVEQTINKLKQL
jgi:hypothetical protein